MIYHRGHLNAFLQFLMHSWFPSSAAAEVVFAAMYSVDQLLPLTILPLFLRQRIPLCLPPENSPWFLCLLQLNKSTPAEPTPAASSCVSTPAPRGPRYSNLLPNFHPSPKLLTCMFCFQKKNRSSHYGKTALCWSAFHLFLWLCFYFNYIWEYCNVFSV